MEIDSCPDSFSPAFYRLASWGHFAWGRLSPQPGAVTAPWQIGWVDLWSLWWAWLFWAGVSTPLWNASLSPLAVARLPAICGVASLRSWPRHINTLYSLQAKMINTQQSNSSAVAMAAYMELAAGLSGSPPKKAQTVAAGGSMSAGTAKSTVARKQTVASKPSASMAAMRKVVSGSVTKSNLQRKSLDPKMVSASANKAPYFSATK